MLAAITPPSSAEPAVNGDAIAKTKNGLVYALHRNDNTVFAGGSFQSVKDRGGPTISSPYLAAFDATTGDHIPGFTPQLDDQVRAIAVSVDGSRIYVGGKFDFVDGQPRRGLVALDATTGRPVSGEVPELMGNVYDLELFGNYLYAVGTFSGSPGLVHRFAARIDLRTGAIDTTWKPDPNKAPKALAVSPDGQRVYIANPTAYAGVTNPGSATVAAVDTVTGARITSFNPTLKQAARDIDATQDRVIVAHGSNNRAVTLDAATGNSLVVHGGDGDFQAALIAADRGLIGSHSRFLGNQTSNRIAAMRLIDGTAETNIAAQVTGTQGVHALLQVGPNLWFGGQIGVVGSTGTWAGHSRVGPADPLGIPSTPQNLQVTSSGQSLVLTWDAATDADGIAGYRILRHGEQIAYITATTYTDTALSTGTTADYRIEAVDNTWTFSESTSSVLGTVGAPPPPDPAGNALVVVKDPAAPQQADTEISSLLTQAGFTVTFADDATVLATDVNANAITVISPTVTSSTIGSKLNSATAPILNGKGWLADDLGLVTGVQTVSLSQIDMASPPPAYSAGLSGTVAILSAAKSVGVGVTSGSAEIVATGAAKDAVYLYRQNALLTDGSNAAGCRGGFPMGKTAMDDLTADGITLFNSVVMELASNC
jgi:hypothetical protein